MYALKEHEIKILVKNYHKSTLLKIEMNSFLINFIPFRQKMHLLALELISVMQTVTRCMLTRQLKIKMV